MAEKKSLSTGQRLLVACTLFGMFFGAGNLIFPVHLGQLAGRNLPLATIGFILTAVGIPILGVAAIGNTRSKGLKDLSGKVGQGYSYFFTILLYLTIGPLFAIPRCATVSFTTGIYPITGGLLSENIALFIFSFLFFLVVLFCSLKPRGITLWIGKIINPIFLIFFAFLIIVALLNPGAHISEIAPEAGYERGAFFNGLVEGYGTMDAIAGLAFGIVVINIIKDMGIKDEGLTAKEVVKSGLMTGLLMAIIYVLSIVMGGESRGLFPLSENGGIALSEISTHYFGNFGMGVLAITITLACLKTSIGLVTACSETFMDLFPGKLNYKAYAVIFTAFSFCISNVGLSAIISISLPVLMLIYPPAICLIILALCGKAFNHDRIVYLSATIFTFGASIFDFLGTLSPTFISTFHLSALISFAEKYLPFYSLNLGWILPFIVGTLIGLLIRALRIKKEGYKQ